MARRRSSSACALGKSAAWRVREATGEAEVERTGGAVRKRRVAGKRRAAIGSARSAGTGEVRGKKREKRID